MYGLQLRLLEQYVESELGKDGLVELKKKCGAGPTEFIQHKKYQEEFFVKLMVQAEKDLNKTSEEILENMGHGLWKYLEATHQGKMLYVCGKSLKDFLYNLDHAHTHLRVSYPDGEFPHFRVEEPAIEGGNVEENNPSPTLIIYYESKRGHNLASYAKGILDSVSAHLYQTKVRVTVAERTSKGAIFHVYSDCPHLGSDESEAQGPDETVGKISTVMERFRLSASDVMHHWPWFFAVDENLKILCMGRTISRIMFSIKLGDALFDHFEVENPLLPKLAFDAIDDYSNSVFVLRSRQPAHRTGEHLLLRGAFELVGEREGKCAGKGLLFLCSPKVQDFETMRKLGITMSDIPLHDATRDLTLLAEHFTTEQRLLKNLEVMSEKVKAEKTRNDEILFSLLPPTVVKDLNKGMRVRGEHVDNVTVLFSDIIGFTNMSSAVTPQRMFSMLDELYTAFDSISTFFDVFKLGTVGDAYMIAGGVPKTNQSSASKAAVAVAGMAIAMTTVAGYVTNPQDGEHIRIRVGLHSGSVMAGIVGTKVPTYCIFGDTVNTASRMESNGEDGRIHCSEDTARILQHAGYTMEKRAEVLDVKGKGRMQTYWVVNQPKELQDIHDRACLAAEEALKAMRERRGSGQTRQDLKEMAGRHRDWLGGFKLPPLQPRPGKPLTPPKDAGPSGPSGGEEGGEDAPSRPGQGGRRQRGSISKSRSFDEVDLVAAELEGAGNLNNCKRVGSSSVRALETTMEDSARSFNPCPSSGSARVERAGSYSARSGSIAEIDATLRVEREMLSLRAELDRLKIRNRQLEAENEMLRHEAPERGCTAADTRPPSRTCVVM